MGFSWNLDGPELFLVDPVRADLRESLRGCQGPAHRLGVCEVSLQPDKQILGMKKSDRSQTTQERI